MDNHYLTLGLERDAAPEHIKRAYRFLCKKYHPDVASPEEQRNFLKIQEAYETLSDREKREAYDRSLKQSIFWSPSYSDFHRYDCRMARGRNQKPASVFNTFFSSSGHSFFHVFSPEARQLSLELILTPREARQGGEYSLCVPVRESCPACEGSGVSFLTHCFFCDGTGYINAMRPVVLHIPQDAVSGTMMEIVLRSHGLPRAILNVEILVR